MKAERIRPGDPCPPLDFSILGGSRLNVDALSPDGRTLIVFYRGLHCPKCKAQLREFDGSMTQFAELGVRPVAVSMDNEKKALDAQRDWEITELPIGYGVSETVASEWGLFISRAEFDYEPQRFCEPGLFLVESDGTLYASWVQSTPFARPRCKDLVHDLKFINEKNYPARGKAA